MDSLLDIIISKGSLKERKVRSLVLQLARTLSLLHKHGVVHRNLKIENIYIGPTGQAILTDLAHATTFSGPLLERTSAQYNPAPELLFPASESTPRPDASQMPYAAAPVDVWGLGVVLYTLACRAVPFDGLTITAIHEASRCSPEGLRFPARVSGDCRDLIRRMLQADPAARATLGEVLAHRWINPTLGRCSLLGGTSEVTKTIYAAIRLPEKVNRDILCRITDDEAQRKKSLLDTLELVAQLTWGEILDSPTGHRHHSLLGCLVAICCIGPTSAL